ncbi:MAG: type II toxin-antitoxin system RelE/ParE family toxin [Kiritimatiellae bacterium]|jgi:hypothetical protein|nr:type II toxin-antitoxin system RelE/ParE family toxin [Kiritimatiellia bacterium]
MNIRILDNAKLDLVDGFCFYEAQENGIGNYFLDTLYSDIDSLLLYAGIHPHKNNFYYMLSKRFPYAIYYKILDNIIYVHAIIDCRREPLSIENRIRTEQTRRW